MVRLQEDILFEEEKLVLPEVSLELRKYRLGYVEQLLQAEEVVAVIGRSETQITSRTKATVLRLESGEEVLLLSNKVTSERGNYVGVLQCLQGNRFKWLSHQLIDEAEERISEVGIDEYAKEVAESWRNQVRYKAEKPSNSTEDLTEDERGLRPPQLGALFSVGSHWSIACSPATIVMPTGTGKTETMLAVLAAHCIRSMLVIVPSKALRGQLTEKFRTFGLLKYLGILPNSAKYPLVAVIKKRAVTDDDLDIFRNCNVAVGVVSSLVGGTASDLLPKIAEIMDALVVDEAHHVAAKSWKSVKESFGSKKVLQFTATPFRNDSHHVDGSVIYSYPLKSAQDDGYFKRIDFVPVYEIDDDESDFIIAKEAVERLRQDLAEDRPHQLFARCGSRARAEDVLKVYEGLASDLNPVLVHSEITDADSRVESIRSGCSKIAVCVNMLGEGVDIPALKIAAIHDQHQSLAVLLQFVGRFTRKGDSRLGDACVVANIGNPKVSKALERLYSEEADWNSILREMSSEAAREHAEFVRFLEKSERFDSESEIPLDCGVSETSLRPVFSSLFFRCESFSPKNFHEGLSDRFDVVSVWLNDDTNTLFFVTRSSDRVKWSNSKEVRKVEWDLFVLHFDVDLKLLYLASSFKGASHEQLAKSVGATSQIVGEDVFRSLGGIGRLVFNNLGVTKHGRRNLSFAMYTGADVKQALSESEKVGSRKSNISGYGWEYGSQITIGCSHRGRVWSKAAGTIPKFIEWASCVGNKLVDEAIETKTIVSNVLIPQHAEKIPESEVLSVDWPNELYSCAEERIELSVDGRNFDFCATELSCLDVCRDTNYIDYAIFTEGEDDPLIGFRMTIKGAEGYDVVQLEDKVALLKLGSREYGLIEFLSDYPPLVRFVDLSELDGNILLASEGAGEAPIDLDRLEVWDWGGTNKKIESIWKNGIERRESIQWKTATIYADNGFDVVYDDDGAGEAADLVCLKDEGEYISLVLIHCKYSQKEKSGARYSDVVEVSSQAVRSARWPGKFKELIGHIRTREKRHGNSGERTGFFVGSVRDLTTFERASRFKEVRPNVLIVQPGVSKSKVSDGQLLILGAAHSYLKQTLNVELDVICSA